MFRALLCPSSGAFLHCTRSLCSPCDVRFDVASSLVQVLVSVLWVACATHHQEPFLHCTRSLRSPCDVWFDVASSLVQVLVSVLWVAYATHHQEPFLHCTRSLCSPCDVWFDVSSSLVQILVHPFYVNIIYVFSMLLSFMFFPTYYAFIYENL
jgi:hypothetical protein